MIREKLYEISPQDEKSFIESFKKKLFPKANKPEHWEILKEWFSMAKEGHYEISFYDATYKTSFGKIDVLEIIDKFDRYPANTSLHDSNPEKLSLIRKYKFLVDQTLAAVRFAKEVYDLLWEQKLKDTKDKNNKNYNDKDLALLITKPEQFYYDKISIPLSEVGLLYPCGITPTPNGEIITYSISIGTVHKFEKWYEGYISDFERILSNNKRQRSFFKKIFPGFKKQPSHDDLSFMYDGVTVGSTLYASQKKGPQFLTYLMLFVTLVVLAFILADIHNGYKITPPDLIAIFLCFVGIIVASLIK